MDRKQRSTPSSNASNSSGSISTERSPIGDLQRANNGEASQVVRERVVTARQRQLARQDKCNHQLSVKELEEVCQLQPADQLMLAQAIEKLGLSTRAYHRVLKVARTLADMEGKEQLQREHIAEALGYRTLDRQV